MAGLGWVARKIGLGLRPEDDTSVSPEDWIEAQLTDTFPRLCADTVEKGPTSIVEWPADLTYDLATRIQRSQDMKKGEEAVDALGLDPDEQDRQKWENFLKYSVRRQDNYRFANAAIYSADQVKQRLSHFWLNHFTVGAKDSTPQTIGDFWNVIYASLDGSFNDMLYRVTSHPAMLTYLDNIYNVGVNSPKGRTCNAADCVVGFNDNLARELMELHTVSPARRYTEADIRGGAMVLSGWGDIFERPWKKPPADWSQPWQPDHAEPGEKTVLGQTIPDGPEGLRVLTDLLANDPATPHFIAGKLARHFIGEAASDEDIAAIETAWISSNGHLPTVHRAVMHRAIASPAKRFHWPIHWMFQVMRMSGANLLGGYQDIGADLMGIVRDPEDLMAELGNSFWSERQPNGFSELKADWVSTEHLDRRVRLADVLASKGKMSATIDDIIARGEFGDATRDLVLLGKGTAQKFMLLACSPEMMEV